MDTYRVPRSSIELVLKRGGMSVVWLHFGFNASDREQKTAVCKLCLKVPSPDANTTNLFHHLQKKHEREYIDFCTRHTV